MDEPNYSLMSDLENRYRLCSGLTSRAHYSIFYGPLRRSGLVVLNANPGGSPTNYRIVDTMAGQHEYVQGKNSGPTTRNGAEILAALAQSAEAATIKRIQVFNRFFRRSPTVPVRATELAYMLGQHHFSRN